jgi:hypothetical protein
MIIDPTKPRNNHWMWQDCCLWLKAVDSRRHTTFYDLSPFNNHFALTQSGSYTWEGGKGRGLTLNTTNSNGLNTLANLPTTGGRTYTAWFRVTNTADSHHNIVTQGGNSGTGSRIQVKALFNSLVGGTAATIYWVEYSGSARWAAWTADTLWHHVAVTTEANTASILVYHDGKLLTTNSYSGTHGTINTNQSFGVGREWDNTTSNALDGCCDDIRVYKRTLSAGEIKTIYDDSVNERYAAINQIGRLRGRKEFESSGSVANILMMQRRRQMAGRAGL